MPTIKDNIKKSGQASRQALSWLRDKQLPPDPVCYAIAFELFHGTDPELKLRVNQLTGNASEMYENMQQIFTDFVLSKQDISLKQLTKKIKALTNSALFSVSDTQSHLKAYSLSLEEVEPAVKDQSGNAVLNVVSLLLKETQNIHQHAKNLEEKLAQTNEQLSQLQAEHLAFKDKALLDPLTQVLNRSGLEEAFEELVETPSSFPISILLADIDLFKSFNDDYGHVIGDKILKLVASTLKKNTKHCDFVSRYGGEEFLILLPATNSENAMLVADQLRQQIQSQAVKKRNTDEYLRQITISIGVSQMSDNCSLKAGIERADSALYRSKREGRNRVNFQN